MPLTFSPPFMENELKKNVTIQFNEYKEKLMPIMTEYGFVVVEGILDKSEQDEGEKLIYDDLLNIIDKTQTYDTRLNKPIQDVIDGKKHWPINSIPGIVSKGFITTRGIPQGKFAWKMRTNEKVRDLFKLLHNSDDLVVGTDVVFFNTENKKTQSTNMWPHADQNIDVKSGSENSYQGILYVWDGSDDGTSNTVVWPKSANKEYYVLQKNVASYTSNEHGLYIDGIADDKVRKELTNGWLKNARRVQVPAGGIIIFNSKTIHQGFPNGWRLAQPISWEPRTARNKDALLKKLQAVHMGIATNHWASLGIHHGASFIKPRKPEYSTNHHRCVFPLKPLLPTILTHQLSNPKTRSEDELLDCVKPEYREYL